MAIGAASWHAESYMTICSCVGRIISQMVDCHTILHLCSILQSGLGGFFWPEIVLWLLITNLFEQWIVLI